MKTALGVLFGAGFGTLGAGVGRLAHNFLAEKKWTPNPATSPRAAAFVSDAMLVLGVLPFAGAGAALGRWIGGEKSARPAQAAVKAVTG